jgi:hypothetical protein
MKSSQQKAAHMLAGAADLLDQGQAVSRLSIAVTAIGVAVLLLPVFPASAATVPTAAAVVLIGLLELLLAARVSFDARLFRRLAEDAAADRLDIDACDAALVGLRLMPVRKAGRPVAKRLAGAKRLLILQGGVFLVQMAVAIVGGSAVFLGLA